jgi:DNA polymerase-3 subunit beta
VLAKAAGGFAGGSVEIALSAGLLGMSAPDRSIITRLMDAEYPDMERLMPPKQETPARVPIDMLSAALRMADKVKAPKAPVLLTLDASNMNVAATDDENAFSDDVMCAYDGAEFTVRVNPEYILGGLAALRAPMADMHVIDNPRAPVLLTASQDGEAVTRPDYQFMFMPIRPVETKTEPVKDATRASLRKKLEET